eukprot:scaffold106281_cov36-Prasinocladus_malaysianus.AAC.1
MESDVRAVGGREACSSTRWRDAVHSVLQSSEGCLLTAKEPDRGTSRRVARARPDELMEIEAIN